MPDETRGDDMTMQFAFGEPKFEGNGNEAADGLRAHAAEVMADLAGATAATLDSLPEELPVEAAVACGNCRLFADAAPQIVFPTWLATAAARRLAGLLTQATRDAERLPDLLDACTGDEAEDLVAGLVHARMDSWAASLQLDDVLEHASDDAERSKLEAAIDAFDEALELFDRAMGAHQSSLTMLADTRLLTNLRSMLAPRHRDPLPWWLDGRLEAEAEAMDAATDDLLSGIPLEPRDARPAVVVLPMARFRSAVTQTYAAAAATSPQAVPDSSWLRWRSPDGHLIAELVPPVVKTATPERLVVDFTDTTGRPALGLAGQRCRLAGVETMIGRLVIDGIDRAIAAFAGAAVLGGATTDVSPVVLVVGDDPAGWSFVGS
jgi:hypothetical protein